jgi:hypothetical protein
MSNGKRQTKGVTVLLFTLMVILVIGCGGSGGGGGTSTTGTVGGTTATTGTTGTTGSTSGAVGFTLQWPAEAPPSRGIPSYAASVEVTVFVTGTSNVVFTEAIDRTQTFPYNQIVNLNLPVGKYTIKLDAKPLAGGQGDTLATATIPITVTNGQNATVTFVMNTVIAKIFIDDLPVEAAVNDSFQLTGHAEDKNGNAVLLPPGALTWSIVSGGAFADLTTGGLFTVLAPGSVTIQAQEIDSGITTTKSISLSAGPTNGVIIIVS